MLTVPVSAPPSFSDTAIVSTSACPSILRFHTMKFCVFFVLCILLAFVSPRDAVAGHEMLKGNGAISSPTRNQKTRSSHTTVPKSSGQVPATSYLTHKSHSAIGPSRGQKTPPSHTIVPKSSKNVPIGHPTTMPTPKMSVRLTTSQKPKSPISRESDPTSTKTPKSSPPPATTTAKSTTTRNSIRSSTLFSASKTLTVSDGQTASAQVGWIVLGVGVGGSVVVGGNILRVEGGTEVIIAENSSGQDELSTISDSDTSTTTTSSTSKSTSKSTSSSTSSSTTSSVLPSPTPYNIYPKRDSTPPQQSAFTQHLEQIAQPGSVRSITGGRDQLLLWVASLTPTQASELSRNPVVSPV